MNDPHDQNDWADISAYEARKRKERAQRNRDHCPPGWWVGPACMLGAVLYGVVVLIYIFV